VTDYEAAMLGYMRSEHKAVLKDIRESGDLSDDSRKKVVAALDAFAKQFA